MAEPDKVSCILEHQTFCATLFCLVWVSLLRGTYVSFLPYPTDSSTGELVLQTDNSCLYRV